MASTAPTTSSHATDEHKRTVDDAFLTKMKSLVERLRLDNSTLKKSLDIERSGVRALKAQHEATLRNLKTEHKRREENLEKQLRNAKPEKPYEETAACSTETKKLVIEIQSLKAANKELQEKLKVSQSEAGSRAGELRAAATRHAALEAAASVQAKKQCLKLLEEIKSKERAILQLQRELRESEARRELDQMQRMECRATELGRKTRPDQVKEKSNREDLKTDIQHRKETFYRASSCDADSAVSSAPPSLSPQPAADMWQCDKCPALEARLAGSAREAARLADALRDARDQLELMEFRVLELEDAAPDKSSRETLTDSDSGCVSPGSRIASASPELKRTDSGYKSPSTSSPPLPRRPRHDFHTDFHKAQIADMDSETDSLKSSPVKDHLEQMILSAASPEDRSCLEQVLMLLYNYQTLSSSVSDDEFQVRPKRGSDSKSPKNEELKTQKAIATVTPYSQKGYKGSLESLDERKPNILQESGIFEGVETENQETQTDALDSFEGELNTEIQRLNSIRERLEKQQRNKSFAQDVEGLECKCVKLGKKHKQYYERRLKFLEGKISIYEAAPDVRQAKLAERLQKEFILENRVQELESEVLELQDKCARLEEDCCELEEIENDTRLHWQQLEMEYSVCAAEARDAAAAREVSRAAAQRAAAELAARSALLHERETELRQRLSRLERAVPALIAWNVLQAVAAPLMPHAERALMSRMCGAGGKIPAEFRRPAPCRALVLASGTTLHQEEELVAQLIAEKRQIERECAELKSTLESKITALEAEMTSLRRQAAAAEASGARRRDDLEKKIRNLEEKIRKDKENENVPVDAATSSKLRALLVAEQDLKGKVCELERREKAYLDMLAQADDMWAEMEGGYKKKLDQFQATEDDLKGKVSKLESEREGWRRCLEPLKQKLREVSESESTLRIHLEKSERDLQALRVQRDTFQEQMKRSDEEAKKSDAALKEFNKKFTKELEQLRKLNKQVEEERKKEKEESVATARTHKSEMSVIRKELNRMLKTNQDLDTTNSELKEEVESLEKQLAITQKALTQCKRKCDDKVKTLSHELSIKTEELEEMRSEAMRRLRPGRVRVGTGPDRTEYWHDGTGSRSLDQYQRRCGCGVLRRHLVGQLIEELFQRLHASADDELATLCQDLAPPTSDDVTPDTKAKITNYLLMVISKELVRSIGDADAKTDTEEWRASSAAVLSAGEGATGTGLGAGCVGGGEGGEGVVRGAARLAGVAGACGAARLAARRPDLAAALRQAHQEVLEHSDVKIMEEQLANAIESIVNCPSCALGTSAIVWSTDV